MKSAVFYGKHDLRVEDSPMPKVGPEDVLIQVKACGVCGTDAVSYTHLDVYKRQGFSSLAASSSCKGPLREFA